jgi:hypothetical protein
MSCLTDNDVEALDKLAALQRNWALCRYGTHFEVTILSEDPPDVRRGDGASIALAVDAALEDLQKHYA